MSVYRSIVVTGESAYSTEESAASVDVMGVVLGDSGHRSGCHNSAPFRK
ncbi:hypothetical protein [Frisingicoccus sp.]|nr:hypothetical protein [Frisingicoccus sp.]